jgi:hypothetical protein
LNFDKNHPSILDICSHVICNECKIKATISEDPESGFQTVCCPVCQ